MDVASAEAIDCGVLLLPHAAEAVNPPVLTFTFPPSYFVVVVAFLPPVNVAPDARIWKFESPVIARARFPAAPATRLLKLTTEPLAVAFTGEPATFRAATMA